MKCIIIDDEPFAIEGLKLNIEKVDFIDVLATFTNPIEANDFLLNNEVDLLFLDIEMPEMTGLDFLRQLKKKPLTIFSTAYQEYAIEGYELGVIDYIVKPYSFARFFTAVQKAKDLHELAQKSSFQFTKEDDQIFFVRSNWKTIKIKFSDVLYIKGLKDYVIIYLKDEHIMTAVNLKTIHLQLPQDIFYRINKSYIINVNHVDAVSQEMVNIGKEELVLSSQIKDDFYQKFIDNKLIKRYLK